MYVCVCVCMRVFMCVCVCVCVCGGGGIWTLFDIGKSRQNKLLVHRQTYMLQDLQTVSTTKHHWTNQVFSLLSLPIAQPGDTTGWAHRAY